MRRRARVIVCALCGRPLDPGADAIEAHGDWFCSPGHLLEFESRSRPADRFKPSRRAALGLIALVVIASAVGYLHSRNPKSALVLDFPNAPKGLAAALADPHRVTLGQGALVRAKRLINAEYVLRDCQTEPESFLDTTAPLGEAVETSCGQQLAEIRRDGERVVGTSIKINRSCDVVSVLSSTQCVVFEVAGPNPHPDSPTSTWTTIELALFLWPTKDGWKIEGLGKSKQEFGHGHAPYAVWSRTLRPERR
jgi:hypothetical protein